MTSRNNSLTELARWICCICAIVVAVSLSTPQAKAVGGKSSLLKLAKTWYYAFEYQRIDRSQLDYNVNKELTADLIRREGARLRSFGKPTSWKYLGSQTVAYAVGHNFLITFAHARVIESVAIDDDGKIGGIDFRMFVER